MIDTLAPLIFTKKTLRQELLCSPPSSSFTSCLLVVLPPIGGDQHRLVGSLALRMWYSSGSYNYHPRVLAQHCFQEKALHFFQEENQGVLLDRSAKKPSYVPSAPVPRAPEQTKALIQRGWIQGAGCMNGYVLWIEQEYKLNGLS